jgi:hypothetical protein
MTEGNRQREQESKRAQYRPRPLEQDIFLPFPVLLLLQTLSRNVGHFGPTLARPTAADLASDLGVEKQELLLRDFGNAGRLVSRAKRLGLDRLLAGVLAPFAQRYMVLARRTLGPGDAGGSGDKCNARAIQSNRARGRFWQDKAKMSKRGVLLRSWLACGSLLKGVTGCGGLGSHIGVRERS